MELIWERNSSKIPDLNKFITFAYLSAYSEKLSNACYFIFIKKHFVFKIVLRNTRI